MRRTATLVLAAALLAGASAAQMSRSPGDDTARRLASATARYDQAREAAIAEALKALETGDAVESAIALHDAVERVGAHPSLLEPLETLREHAAGAAEARVDRMLREGRVREAITLLARVGAVASSERLDELLDRATVDLRLLEAAEFEASGERIRAMEAVAIAIQIAPADARVRAAAERAGLRTVPSPPAQTTRPSAPARPAAPTALPANASVDARLSALESELRRVLDSMSTPVVDATAGRAEQRIDQLDRDLRRQTLDLDRVARIVDEMNSRQRLDGRAEYATNELDRRVRELERTISTLQREVSSLNNDVRSLQRSAGRP